MAGPFKFFLGSSFFLGELGFDPEGESFLSFFGLGPLKLLDFTVAAR